MNLKTLFEACSIVCDKHIAKNEAACVRLGEELIPYTELKAEIEKLKEWCYPKLDTSTIKQIVNCRNCAHYKMCTRTIPNNPKPQVTFVCGLDNTPKPAEHYCSFAKEKI